MVRVTIGAARRRKKNRYFKQAKGYWGGRSKLWRTVRETLLRAWAYASRDRRHKKRVFRRLWITRINAAARQEGLSYNQFVHGCQKANIELDRKVLAELAVNEPAAFKAIAAQAKAALEA